MSVRRSRFMVHNNRWSEMVSSSMLFGPKRIEEESEVLRSPWYGHGGHILGCTGPRTRYFPGTLFGAPKMKNKTGPRGPGFAPRKWSRISRPENGHPEERTNERTPRGHEKCAHFLATKSGAGDPPKKRPRRDKKRYKKTKRRELI